MVLLQGTPSGAAVGEDPSTSLHLPSNSRPICLTDFVPFHCIGWLSWCVNLQLVNNARLRSAGL